MHFTSVRCSSILKRFYQNHPSTALNEKLRHLCITGMLADAIGLLCAAKTCIHPQTYALLLQEAIHRNESKLGRRIHTRIIISGFTPNEYLITKFLIFYAKDGDLWTARKLFDRIPERNLISSNAMITGFVRKGLHQEGLDVLYSMRSAGLVPDQFTFASAFRACAGLAMLEQGKRVHGVLIKLHVTANVFVTSALVDMYFKCASSDDALRAFECSSERNVVTWTALISGYGQHGRVVEVLRLFHQMIEEGVRPNSVTFLAVLFACSHGGLIDAGWNLFNSMASDYRIEPRGEHYAAMVDMLGRAGRINEAYELVIRSPCKEHSVIWGALLGACRIHGDLETLKLAAEKFFEMQPANAGKYIVLANAYATNGMWQNVMDVHGKIRALGMKKELAWSSIHVHGVVHTFLVKDNNHAEHERIYETIDALRYALAEAGYVSTTNVHSSKN